MIDISRTIGPGALVYPGDSPIGFRPFCRIGPNSPFNLTELRWTTHILTHIDAPLHFIADGASLDQIPLERFLGEAIVIQVDGDAVQPEHVPTEARGLNLLFKTRNSAAWDPLVSDRNHVYVSKRAAEAMVERGVNLAGIDYLSIDRFGDEAYPAHRTLLGNGVLILEGLDLEHVEPGPYRLLALPLKIEAADGSPVRAVLIPAGI